MKVANNSYKGAFLQVIEEPYLRNSKLSYDGSKRPFKNKQ